MKFKRLKQTLLGRKSNRRISPSVPTERKHLNLFFLPIRCLQHIYSFRRNVWLVVEDAQSIYTFPRNVSCWGDKLICALLLLLIGLILPILSFGNDQARTLFAKGNAFYAKAQYKEALDTYQQLTGDGYRSAALYFNMGNASYKNDDIPSAILYYEKAHKIAPGDDDINFNIRFANLKTTDKIDEVPEFFLANWWKAFILSFSLNTLSALSVILVLLGSAILVIYLFTNSVAVKKFSFYTSIMFFFLGVFAIFIGGMQENYFTGHRQAIVFSSSATVKSGPLDKSGGLFVIHDGSKVTILDNSNGWIKIRLANGNVGWIKSSDVKEI